MSTGPKTPQEALNKAFLLVNRLRDNLPGKAGHVLTCMDEIVAAWENQDLTQFPFNTLQGEVNALKDSAASDYDLDQQVDRRSSLYEQVVTLEQRVRMSLEFVVSSKIFEGVEQRFRRIDDVLPARNYSVRDLLAHLSSPHIDLPAKHRLERALNLFDRQEYEGVIQECGKFGEAMLTSYRSSLCGYGRDVITNQFGPELEQIRRWLGESKEKDHEGCSLSRRSRIEWFLLHMFEALHYLRNVGAHDLRSEEDLPAWQNHRRRMFGEKSEYARLALCLSFQIAIELQAVLEHQSVGR